MFKDYIELINWVNDLIPKLKSLGEDELAEKVNFAIRIGGTSSELLGAIRKVLMEIEETTIPKKIGIKREIRAAIKKLNKDLGRLPRGFYKT